MQKNTPPQPTDRAAGTSDGLVIDLRESAVAAAGIDSEDEPEPGTALRVSGRPDSLLPQHRIREMTTDAELEAAEGFLYDIYLDIGYCEESPRRRVEELVPWADRAHFFAILDEEDEVIGTIRTIHGNYDELPVAQFDRFDYTHPDPVCELSSLVVKPNHRSTGVIEHLYRAGWLDAYRAGSSAIVGLIDPWLYDVFRDHYALPFVRIGQPHHYMGTDPVPVALPLVGSAYDVVARNNPQFWLWTLEALEQEEIARWGLPIILTDPVVDLTEPAAVVPTDEDAPTGS